MTTRLSTALAFLVATSTAHSAAGAETTRFPIRDIQVDGNTLVGDDALKLRLTKFLGEERSVDDLLEARAAITSAYQEAGRPMVAVGLPEEFPADGTLRLKVIEIPVREIRITGNQRLTPAQIRARIPALAENESPAIEAIARQVALANDNPALKMTVDFEARDDMAADAKVVVTEQPPLSVSINADNTGTDETGRWRLGLSVAHADVSGRGDVATATYITAPQNPDQVHQFAASYLLPLPSLGDTLLFTASYSDVDAGRVDAFSVAGEGSSVGVRYQHSLVRTVTRRHIVEVGLERRRYRNVVDFEGEDLGHDLSSRPLSVGYAFAGQHDALQWAGSVNYVRNLLGGTDNSDRAYDEARFNAPARWSLWRASGRTAARLPLGLLAQVTAEAQHSDDPLISGETFGVGGARSVRGFEEREVTGDRGWRVGGELTTPRAGPLGRFAVFTDRGGAHRISALPGERADEVISSWGLGWRFNASGFAALVDWARVIDGTENTAAGDHKVHVQASMQF